MMSYLCTLFHSTHSLYPGISQLHIHIHLCNHTSPLLIELGQPEYNFFVYYHLFWFFVFISLIFLLKLLSMHVKFSPQWSQSYLIFSLCTARPLVGVHVEVRRQLQACPQPPRYGCRTPRVLCSAVGILKDVYIKVAPSLVGAADSRVTT